MPLSSLTKHLGVHLLEHSAIVNIAKAGLFASKGLSDSAALTLLIKSMGNAMKTSDLSEGSWLEAASKVDLKDFEDKGSK